MPSHTASIERSNRKDMPKVEVELTVSESTSGRQVWSGEFIARSLDGILPDERLSLTLDSGEKGTVRVIETSFDSRIPQATRIRFTGTGQPA